MKWKSQNNLIYLLLIIIGLLLIKQTCNRSENKKIVNNLHSELTSYINKNGEQVSTINQITSERIKDFLKIDSQDSLIKELQKQVKDYKKQINSGGSVTVVTGETNVIETVVTHYDTIFQSSIDTYYLQRRFSFEDRWIDLNGIVRDDSTTFNLKVRNEYTFVVGKKKGNHFVEIINHNPYSVTTDMKSYTTLIPIKKFGIGFQIGYGLTLKGFSPYVGIGLNYSFIRF